MRCDICGQQTGCEDRAGILDTEFATRMPFSSHLLPSLYRFNLFLLLRLFLKNPKNMIFSPETLGEIKNQKNSIKTGIFQEALQKFWLFMDLRVPKSVEMYLK